MSTLSLRSAWHALPASAAVALAGARAAFAVDPGATGAIFDVAIHRTHGIRDDTVVRRSARPGRGLRFDRRPR